MLDPTISLKAASPPVQFDPMAAAERGLRLGELMMRPDILQQQLSSARTAEALTREQILASQAAQKLTAEQTAEAEQRRLEELRQQQGQKWLAGNVKNFYDKKTGKLNNEALIDAYMEAGHPPEQIFKFRESANKELTDRLKSKADQQTYADNRMMFISNLIDRLPKTPEGERQARSILNTEMNSLKNTFGDEVAFQSVSQRFGESAIPGTDQPQMIQTPGGGTAVAPPRSPSIFQAARQNVESTRTEQQRVEESIQRQQLALSAGQLAVAQRQVALSESANKATPEDKDPNSTASKNTRQLLEFLKVDPKLYEGKSSYEIARDPYLNTYVKSIQPTVEMRAQDFAAIEAAKSEIEPYNTGLASANRLVDIKTLPGSVAIDTWRKYVTQNPDAAAVQRAVDAYNLKNKTNINVPRDGLGPVVKLLQGEQSRLGAKVEAGISGATAPTIPQAVGEITRAQSVKIVNKSTGDVTAVPKDVAEKAIASGKYQYANKP